MNKKIKIIVGANYGDEGKGLATDYFCNPYEFTLGVLTNGSSQRGHTVDTSDNHHHVFHHFSSGTFQGATTYIGKDFAINPITCVNEYAKLSKHNIILPIMAIHPDCKVVTPFDMMANQTQRITQNLHNTCGAGFWTTLNRYNHGENELTVKDIKMFSWENLYKKIKRISSYYPSNSYYNDVDIDNLIKHFINDLMVFRTMFIILPETTLSTFNNIVFENGQGLMIGEQNRFANWDFCTPSNTGIKYAVDIIERNITNADIEVCYVSRTYLTRHGDGEFNEECSVLDIGKNLIDFTNIFNENQGDLRYGQLNVEELLDRILCDFSYINFLKTSNNYSLSLMFTHWNEKQINLKDLITEKRINNIYISDGKTKESVIKIK